MKKVLTLLLTIVMTVCLIVLNGSRTKAEENAPSKIENLSNFISSMPDLHSVKKITFTKNTEEPSGWEEITTPCINQDVISSNARAFVNANSNPTEILFCCSEGFIDSGNKGTNNLNFRNRSHITTIDFGDAYQLEDITNMQLNGYFQGCSGLTELDLSWMNTSKVINMKDMFNGCTNLSKIKVSNNFKTDLVTESTNMFAGSTNLPNFDANYVDKTKAIDVSIGGYLYNVDIPRPTPSPDPQPKDESCEKVIGPTWHWNESKGICEEYSTVGTSTK